MSKVEFRKLRAAELKATEVEWQETLLRASGKKDIVRFLKEFLTASERLMLARRIQVARRLIAGYSFLAIKHELGVGLEMISRVDALLQRTLEGYRTMLPKHVHRVRPGVWEVDPQSLRGLRLRYPAYFWFLDLFLR